MKFATDMMTTLEGRSDPFGEFCPVCDRADVDTFVHVPISFDDGDIVECEKGHKLSCWFTDSQFVDVRLKAVETTALPATPQGDA